MISFRCLEQYVERLHLPAYRRLTTIIMGKRLWTAFNCPKEWNGIRIKPSFYRHHPIFIGYRTTQRTEDSPCEPPSC